MEESELEDEDTTLGTLVIRSMVSLRDGRRCASRRGRSPRLLWRLVRESDADGHLGLSWVVPRCTFTAGSNSKESEETGWEGYEMGTKEFRRSDEKPASR